MKIEKIDTGYLIEYDEEISNNSDFNSYTYHKYAFSSWEDMVNWISKNEGLMK